jgi:hypothetical protein
MTPHIAWAFKQRNLTPLQRLVLMAISEYANGDRLGAPSISTIANAIEATRKTVIVAVRFLSEDRKLISLVTDPAKRQAFFKHVGMPLNCRANVYRINRPADGVTATPSRGATNGVTATPSRRANGVTATPSDGVTKTPSRRRMVKLLHQDGVTRTPTDGVAATPEPLINPLMNPLTRATASHAGASAAAPAPEASKEDFQTDEKGKEASGAPAKAPVIGTTNGSAPPSNAFQPPGGRRDPFDPDAGSVVFLDRMRGKPSRLDAQPGDVLVADVADEDDSVGPKATAAVVRGLGRQMRHFAIPHGPKDRDQQIAELDTSAMPGVAKPQQAVRTPAEQYAQLMGCSVEEAMQRMPAVADA